MLLHLWSLSAALRLLAGGLQQTYELCGEPSAGRRQDAGLAVSPGPRCQDLPVLVLISVRPSP